MEPTTPLRIADIHTTAIIYYDPSAVNKCYDFCRSRDIDALPALDDSNSLYVVNLSAQAFVCEDITEERKVSVTELIFSPVMLERFRRIPLLLTYDNSSLAGVIHFSDYGKPAVSIYLYSVLFDYERALREFLLRKGCDNQTMLAYFEHKAGKAKKRDYYQNKIDRYNNKREENEHLPKFQMFYLEDLIGLAVHRGLNLDQRHVPALRNSIMHAHELVSQQDYTIDNLIYDFASFERFFLRVRELLLDYKRVRNQLALM